MVGLPLCIAIQVDFPTKVVQSENLLSLNSRQQRTEQIIAQRNFNYTTLYYQGFNLNTYK